MALARDVTAGAPTALWTKGMVNHKSLQRDELGSSESAVQSLRGL